MSFNEFNLKEEILRAIDDLGFTEPSDIQEQAIPVLKGYEGDFVGQAQTGTGKTAAFVIPLLDKIDLKVRDIQALIIAPTRELANQVHEEVLKLSKYMRLSSTTVYGGVSYTKQINAIKKDRPQIIVGTPGRLIDLIDRGVLRLENCKQLVIDEADEMLNMGFIDDVQTIIDSLDDDKKMWMFSATMPKPIVRLIEDKFSKPKIVRVEKKTLSNENIEQLYCVLKKKNFPKALQRVIDSTEDLYGIVFCETRQETKELSDLLLIKGISAVSLHGELSQNERDQSMKRFRDRKANLLICTDVAARGIDVSNVSHVFNMGFPRQIESYVHRIGRTGRAGLTGKAINFISPDDTRKLRRIEGITGQKMSELSLPKPLELKRIKVSNELTKMDAIKGAIIEREETFRLDDAFSQFNEYFNDLTKEQALKVLFAYRFNKELRAIDEAGEIDLDRFNDDRGRSRGGSRGRRSNGRSDRGPRSNGQQRRSRGNDRNSERGSDRGSERRSGPRIKKYGQSKPKNKGQQQYL